MSISLRPRFLVATLAAGALVAACSGSEQYRLETLGAVQAPAGPVAAGPLTEAGGGLLEAGVSTGIVPYEQEPRLDPPANIVAATQLNFRVAYGALDALEIGMVGGFTMIDWSRPQSPAVQRHDIEARGSLETAALTVRARFIPDVPWDFGMSFAGGVRSAAYERSILPLSEDGATPTTDRGERARWFIQGGFFGGAPVAGPLWLGMSLNMENAAVATGERTVTVACSDEECAHADAAARSTARFRDAFVVTPSLDAELRFGVFGLGVSAFGSLSGDVDAPTMPFGVRTSLRLRFGPGGGESPETPRLDRAAAL